MYSKGKGMSSILTAIQDQNHLLPIYKRAGGSSFLSNINIIGLRNSLTPYE